MENENVMDFKGIRATARQKLSGNWPLSIGVAVVACLLGGLIAGTSFLPDVTKKLTDTLPDALANGNFRVLVGTLTVSLTGGFWGLVTFIIGGTIQLGYAQYLLNQHDGKEFSFNDLFSQFHRFGQGFAQNFLTGLYVFLWMLLFIVPGIIKAFSYAMTPFIMAENPDLSANEAITRSREIMNGHKLELFVLSLTFIGWGILSALTMNLGHIFLNPYVNASYAVFYRQISGQKRYYEM